MSQDVSKPVNFPAYRRSHFRSQTYLALVRIFSHFPATPNNGGDSMEQEEPEKGPEFSKFTGSASVDPEDPVLEKTTQEIHEITKGVGDKGRESATNDVLLHDIEHMLGIKEVEDSLTRQEENMSKKENDLAEHQKTMDNLEGAVEGTEDLLCDSGLISFVSGLGEKRDGNNEVELMGYQIDGRLVDSDIPIDQLQKQNEENKRDMEEGELTPNSSSILIEKGVIEEGELAGDFGMDGKCDYVLTPGNSKDDSHNHGNSSASKQKVDNIGKKKHGPGFEERKTKRKEKKRKNRAENNKQLGVKKLKLHSVQNSKTIIYCRHYLVGRCHKGDKCKFSHDTVPLTKSTPCRHFARHSCMKGDDCPFDHELSKYPCNNFVSRGFCSRGYACLFSHQLPPKEDSPMLSGVSKPELKYPLLSRDTSFSVPANSRGSSVQPINSMGIHSLITSEDTVTGIVQQQPTPRPKGISFINIEKSLLPIPSTQEQGLVTPNKESLVQIEACSDQSEFGTDQTLVEIPEKLLVVAPKGVNFLCFDKSFVYSFESSISSLSNKEHRIKVPEFVNFGFPTNPSSSLKKHYCSKEINGTSQSVPRIDLVAEGMKSSFPGTAWTYDARIDLLGSSNSHADYRCSKSVQETKESSDNSQTSTATSSRLLLFQFGLHQYSECLPFGNHEHASHLGGQAKGQSFQLRDLQKNVNQLLR